MEEMNEIPPIQSVLENAFEVPLHDLAELDARLRGILCPEPEIGAEKIGITEQFLTNAETYHARYSNAAHFSQLFEQAFQEAGIVSGISSTVLDIGTGLRDQHHRSLPYLV
jgi:hypothetical protein